MRPRIHSKVLLPLFVVVLLVACSDDRTAEGDAGGVGGNAIGSTDTTAAVVTTGATSVAPAPTETEGEATLATGRILVTSSPITGHEGHVLLVFGPNNESEICATIDSDPWTLEEVALTDRTADSDPCSGVASDTVFAPGEHAVTASIFVPGSRTALSSTAALVELVDGDVQLRLDGSEFSDATTGDPGRISVTVSEITGQSGKILVIIGQNNAASLCAVIDTDPWALPTPGVLRELPGGDGGPCSEDTPEVFFPAGDTRIAAAVVIPGNPSPDASVDIVVPVDGDVSVSIDGARLSR